MAPPIAAASPHTTHTSTTSTLVPCPTDAPPWFAHAYEQMTQTDLGCHYHALVAAWIRIEHASRFENGPTNLSPKGRPQQVGNWVSFLRGKRKGADVAVTDPAAYAVGWQVWWDSLQPEWRKKGKEGEWIMEGEYGGGGREWGPLYRWGINGMLNVVVSLYFWGCGVMGGTDAALLSWEKAIHDCTWMMEGMAAYYELFKHKF
ncbi:hypothetical protein B0H13DRAFT_1618324 [Mycena leptocephala]|nr:hypothetical protein B0H13DRAFT_1618324 [Mycena leptocephala]